MTKLYNKNPLTFAILWIILYVVGLSAADNLSLSLGVEKSVSLPVCMLMSAVLFVWIRKNSLQKAFGLCRSKIPAKDLLWYLPLIAMTSVNLWLGAVLNMSVTETVLYILSMLLVGFLEEIIFRGLLFKAMCPHPRRRPNLRRKRRSHSTSSAQRSWRCAIKRGSLQRISCPHTAMQSSPMSPIPPTLTCMPSWRRCNARYPCPALPVLL